MNNKVTIKFKDFTIETDGTVDISIDGDKVTISGKPLYTYILNGNSGTGQVVDIGQRNIQPCYPQPIINPYPNTEPYGTPIVTKPIITS